MYSRFATLLLSIACVHVSSSQPKRIHVHRYLFTPKDYRLINELALALPQTGDPDSHTNRYDPLAARYLQPPSRDSVSEYSRFLPEDPVPKNHRPYSTPVEEEVTEKLQPAYVRDHAPAQQIESEVALESEAKVKKKPVEEESSEKLMLSPDGDRVEFQIQGHDGPKSYIFGFDTGDGKNRQFRLEERLKDGSVKGHYGYYDARGKLRAISYSARPFEGYREKHHVSSNLSSPSSE